jgi:hypothetical protein
MLRVAKDQVCRTGDISFLVLDFPLLGDLLGLVCGAREAMSSMRKFEALPWIDRCGGAAAPTNLFIHV